MFYWIYDYPTAYVGASFAVVFVGFTWLGLFLFRPLVRPWLHAQRSANDMVGFTLASFSVLYGILLGLLAVEAYQNYNSANDIVSKEAASLAALYADLDGYPEPLRDQLRSGLRNYAEEVLERSWPLQRRGLAPTGEGPPIRAFFRTMISFNPKEKREEIIHAEALRQFNVLIEQRRARLDNVDTGIPAILWGVVALGALFHVVLIWMLDMEAHVHVLLSGLLAAFIGVVIFAVAAMDNPFRGDVSGGPEAIRTVYLNVMKPN